MNDLRGREITVGSTIAWPDRRGSHLYQHVGEVVEVGHDRIKVKRTHTSGYATIGSVTTVHRTERVVVLAA